MRHYLQEIQDLELLKEITRCQPICFVRVPAPEIPAQNVAGSPFGFPVVQNLPSSPRGKTPTSFNQSNIDANDNVTTNSDNNVGMPSVNKLSIDSDHSTSQKTNTEITNKETADTVKGNNLEGSTSHRHGKVYCMSIPPKTCRPIFSQLCKLGYLTETPGMRNISQNIVEDYFEIDSILVPDFDSFMQRFTSFSEQTLQRYLVNAVTVLNHTHIRCLQTFIICAFDMAREVLVTPKKILFAKEKEEDLYNSLFKIAVDKGDEIQNMIELTLDECKSKLIEKVEEYDFIGKCRFFFTYTFSGIRNCILNQGLQKAKEIMNTKLR